MRSLSIRISRRRASALASVIFASLLWMPIAGADPLDEYSSLETRMAQAQEAYIEAREDAKGHADGTPSSDLRLGYLKLMDRLTVAHLDTPDGAIMAMDTFYWSWNLDLDLPRLHDRFARLVKHYPDDPAVGDALTQLPDIVAAVKGGEAWARTLETLDKKATRDETRIATLLALGQVHYRGGRHPEAKAVFGKLLERKPPKETREVAKGWIHEIDHLQVGMVAPEIIVRTFDGKEVALSSLRGKAVLLNYWASW